jgi:peptidoglycan hydrolase CwlO-like protein
MQTTDQKIDNLENKLDMGLSEINKKIDSLADLFESFANHSMGEFKKIDERFEKVESEIKEIRQDILRTELNLIDRLASNKRVDEIETRVKVLESQVL